MQEREFYHFSAGIVAKLDQARRAARREAQTGYVPSVNNADALMLEAATRLKQREGWGDLTSDQSQVLWSKYGLVQLYLSYVEGNGEPLAWQHWLNSRNGKEALARFPQRELQAARRDARISYDAHVAGIEAARADRRAQREQAKVRGSASRIVSQAALNDPNEDPLRNLCRVVKQEHGTEWSDKRPKGGTLKVAYMYSAGPTADRLRAAGFSFSASVGWWRK